MGSNGVKLVFQGQVAKGNENEAALPAAHPSCRMGRVKRTNVKLEAKHVPPTYMQQFVLGAPRPPAPNTNCCIYVILNHARGLLIAQLNWYLFS